MKRKFHVRLLGANRQRIAQPKSRVSRQRIAHLNYRENRHFRRGICRFYTPPSSSAEYLKFALLPRRLIAPIRNGQENQGFLGVASASSADRAAVEQSNEGRLVCHQMLSGPTPNAAIRCRSKATKAERSAVGKS
jgi:hypothetical protein